MTRSKANGTPRHLAQSGAGGRFGPSVLAQRWHVEHEDVFWSLYLPSYNPFFRIAPLSEALQRDYGIELMAGESRRNITTRGVALNHLVGREFRIGEIRARGLRLCEPCSHLEKLTGKRLIKGLLHRGGLRAQILTAGDVRVGDEITAE